MPQHTQTRKVELDDGRTVSILTYDDGSIRFRINGGVPYAISEAYLQGSSNQHGIIKLIPLHRD